MVGCYVALSKPLVAVFPVFLLAWLRFGIAAVAMWRWLPVRAGDAPLTSRTRRLLFLESFLGNFLFSVCMLSGMALTTAVSAGVIMSAIPAMVALLSGLFLKERIGTQTALGIVCAAIGIALFSLQKPADPSVSELVGLFGWRLSIWGNLLVFAAVLCEASYVVIGKRLTDAVSPKRIAAIINLWGFALVTPLGLWTALSFDFTRVETPIWGLLVFYALAASVWSVWLWMTGVKSIPANRAGVYAILLPITSAAVGVSLLGETMTWVQLIAFGIALLGLLLATWTVDSR